MLSGTTIPELSSFSSNQDIRKEKSIILDSRVNILGFSSEIGNEEEFLGYYIEAPYARGMFFTGSLVPFSSTGVFLRIGYNGAQLESGRAREILLRPYLQ